MVKSSKKKGGNKRLKALLQAQRITELIKIGGIQGQALLDGAGENRPNDETHVVELLESGIPTGTETTPKRRAGKSSKKKAKPKQKQKGKKKRR